MANYQASQPFTLEKIYNIVRDRLGVLHNGNVDYQEATFMADAKACGRHVHSLLIGAGDRFYDELSAVQTVTANSESTDLFPTFRNEISKVRRIWLLDEDDRLLTTLDSRAVDRTDISTGANPSYEVINNVMYWFPPPGGEIKVKLEYVRHFDGDLSLNRDKVDETGDEMDIPEYAQDYYLNELTVRAGMALKQNMSQWISLAMNSKQSMLMNAARNVPRRKWVLFGGR